MDEELIENSEGSTPLGPEELEGLIPTHIRTREELDEWENQNVLKAHVWATSRRRDVLDEQFLRELHRRMFDETWVWAGQYRNSDKNIGIDHNQLKQGIVLNLCEDVKARLKSGADVADTAMWFHHQLTWIHPFPNGNGRHARLMTDLLLAAYALPPFTWGRGDLLRSGETRDAYIAALRQADQGNYGPLEKFLLS